MALTGLIRKLVRTSDQRPFVPAGDLGQVPSGLQLPPTVRWSLWVVQTARLYSQDDPDPGTLVAPRAQGHLGEKRHPP